MSEQSRSGVTQEITEMDGQALLRLCEDNPIVACRDESRFSCAYKQQFGHRLEKYNLEKLLEHPNCEACGCPLVVIRDD